MSRYLVGIDLGTTNIAVAYVDLLEKVKDKSGPRLRTFPIPQLVGPGDVASRDLLPSFLYLPGPHDLPPGATDLPWRKENNEVVGLFARQQGAKIPGRQVASAKSWLCHPSVDRTAPLLPWSAPPDVPRLSPLDVSARYLRHIVEAWNHAAGRKSEDLLEEQAVVITVPASFDDVARNLTAQAAQQAGLKNVMLLEEPQAAFYAWLGTHDPDESTRLIPGMRCAVIDVGGGTTDFSLIRAVEEHGELAFLRDAVGDHLLLGGDNMDLALARAIEGRLAIRLDAGQFAALVQACREAKERLLADDAPSQWPVTVMGRGRSVVSGSASVTLTTEDVQKTLFEGFFPEVDFSASPSRGARTGLQEMGLPYVSDPAITRHLAAFLREHLGETNAGRRIDAILFNGGVFQPRRLRERLIQVMTPWFSSNSEWNPQILTSPSLDLAVAWGAAYFAWLKHTGGKRIGGGIPRSYYIGLAQGTPQTAGGGDPSTTSSREGTSQADDSLTVLCVVPRRLQEGEEISLKEPELELAIGRPVLFPLYTSTVRSEDRAGDVLHLPPSTLLALPALHTLLRGGKRAGTKRVPVTLAARCTEIGTLELACVSREGNRWKLEFNLRDVIYESHAGDAGEHMSNSIQDVFPEEKIQAVHQAILATFQNPAGPSPQDLIKRMEAILEVPRNDWPSAFCRRLWDVLDEVADLRRKSPAHLARWYNLVGFSLRPGFGDPLDRYRVESLWKRIHASASSQSSKTPAIPEGSADYWIMWRRVAGGLNAAWQQALFARLRPQLLPAKGKAFTRPPANEYAEMWRTAASLERLDQKTKEQLGAALLQTLRQSPVPPYTFWSLTRLGARVPFYGPLNTILHPDIAEAWVDQLITFVPSHESERLAWLFCLSQLARQSGLRAVDLSEATRCRVLDVLKGQTTPATWPKMVEEVVGTAQADRTQLFGESLPIGLRLAGGMATH